MVNGADLQEFRLPDVGEGLTEAEIVTWKVAVGDQVERDQALVEIETAKSLVELPSPFEGTVEALLVRVGETVPVGTPIVRIGGSGSLVAQESAGANAQPEKRDADPAPSVLVGYGPSDTVRTRRRRRPSGATTEPDPALVPPAPARATPPVRKLAKDLGVDLGLVAGTGPDGRIVRTDVLDHRERSAPEASAAAPTDPAPTDPAPARPADRPTSSTTRIPVRGVRKATAAAMSASAFSAPHVTEFLTVDVTRSVRLVERLKSDPAIGGARVSMLLIVARAVIVAVREFPEINASWDGVAEEIVIHHRVNLGIAAATPRGLLVPNIKDAGALSLPKLATALTGLVATAREGRSTPEEMSGGTITITNIGVFGVDAGTPILNPGEAAILCLGAVHRTPWEHKGQVALRWTTQLALSFDHRLVDGELGSRVLARIGAVLRHPRRELLLA